MDVRSRHQLVTDLFMQAMELPPDSRESWLEQREVPDPSVLIQVRDLIRFDPNTALIDVPALDGDVDVHAIAESVAALPEVPGFRLVTLLGQGGMGAVYLAEQVRPRRQVALKVIRPECTTPSAVRRLAHESDILARLEHPSIARVLAAGSYRAPGSNTDLPYFAMEIVLGEPMTEYAISRGLTVRERLELFAAVCDAVQHAHTRGVIHRDIKPSNVLVTNDGEPKVLDFGVARLAETANSTITIETKIGHIIGTLQYMSPEQARGDARAIDTRSDVYSLGVLLFALVGERSPYQTSGKPLSEALRTVIETPPERLGLRRRELRGDIEALAAKALEKSVEARYQSAFELGADVRRFLRGEAIQARTASIWYLLRKYASRHKPLMGVIVAALLLATAGVAVFSSRRQADFARRRFTIAQELLHEVLGGSNRVSAELPNSFIAVLERAVTLVDSGYAPDPLAEADLRRTIGLSFDAVGVPMKGADQLQKTLDLRSATLGPDAEPTLDAYEELAMIQSQFAWATSNLKDYLATVDRHLALRISHAGPDDPATLRAQVVVAMAEGMPRTDRTLQSHQRFRQVLPRLRIAFGADHIIMLRAMRAFANTATSNEEALEHLESLRVIVSTKYGESSPELVDVMVSKGARLRVQGMLDSSVDVLLDAVKRADQHLSEEHYLRWEAHHQLGRSLTKAGRYVEAEPHLRLAYQRVRPDSSTAPFFERYGDILQALMELHDLRGEWADAERLSKVFWEEHVRWWEHPPYYRYQIRHLSDLARFVAEQGRLFEAQALLNQAEVIRAANHAELPHLSARGSVLAAQGRLAMLEGQDAVAVQLLEEAFRTIAMFGVHDDHIDLFDGNRIVDWLSDLHVRIGNPKEVERWKRVAALWNARDIHGRLLIHAKRYDVAEEYLVPRFAEFRRVAGETDPRTIDIARTLVELYRSMGRPHELAEVLVYLASVGADPEDNLFQD